MKIDLEDINSVLSDLEGEGVDVRITNKVRKAIDERLKEIEEEKEDEVKEPRVKSQFVIVCSDEQYDLPVRDASLWIMKVPEDKDHTTIESDLNIAAVNFNEFDRKAKKNPIKGLVDALRTLKKKHFGHIQNSKLIPKILTPEPCIVVAAPKNITIN